LYFRKRIIFLNISASNEWHPFTISSAPERNDILRINIMKKKNWTKKVYEHFNAFLHHSNHIPDVINVKIDHANYYSYKLYANEISSNEIKFSAEEKNAIISIEGPFSTCTSYIFDCEHVVLIGAGIGITPYISALDSIIHQFREQRCICTNCSTTTYNHEKIANRKLKKVDFIWVNRDFKNFAWFLNILHEFENEQESYLNDISSNTTNSQEQRSRYLDIHLYCTAIGSNEQAMLGNVLYDLVANMYEYREQKDMHTQLRTRTHVGRPSWRPLFEKFKDEHRTTNVFLIANPTMRDAIKGYCDEFGFPFRNEPGF